MSRLRTTVMSVLALGHVSLAACASPSGIDFSREAFAPIPRLHALDWTRVLPGEEWDYWEVRAAGLVSPDSVVGSGGTLTRAELEPEVREALATARPPTGFAAGCLPGYCYHYLVAVREGALTTVASADGLRAFLAPITTTEEAVLAVAARSYLSWDDGEHTGVRPVVGIGWDVVVFELVRDCTPVQTDRVRYRVGPEGAVTERAREVWERLENACV